MIKFPNVVANYLCVICGVKGDHWIMQCPNNDSVERQKDLTISTLPFLICGYTRKIKMHIPSDVTNLIELFHSKVIINNECYIIKPIIQPLQPDPTAFKWSHDLDDSYITINAAPKWNTLDHNGVIFPPEYEPHGVPIKYDDKEILLTPDQEEIATMFAKKIHTDWVHKNTFRNNFMKDFKKILCDKNQKITYPHITDLDLCDFNAIYDWFRNSNSIKIKMRKIQIRDTNYQQEMIKTEETYGYAIVDGVRETISIDNYRVESPCLLCDEDHPKMGRVKRRILPKDIILNIGENTPIPPCPIPGQQWGGIIHDNTGNYIAKWDGKINRQPKFAYIDGAQRSKGESNKRQCDRSEDEYNYIYIYERADLLKTKIDSIRKDCETKLTCNHLYTKQLATAVWMIDKLWIQVGEDECEINDVCSLRKRHITFLPRKNNVSDENEYGVSLNFALDIHTLEVPHQIWQNLNEFLQGKNDNMDVFEMIATRNVNHYLECQMNGFRMSDKTRSLSEAMQWSPKYIFFANKSFYI